MVSHLCLCDPDSNLRVRIAAAGLSLLNASDISAIRGPGGLRCVYRKGIAQLAIGDAPDGDLSRTTLFREPDAVGGPVNCCSLRARELFYHLARQCLDDAHAWLVLAD